MFVLKPLEMENTAFFEPKCQWKYDVYRFLKSSCFELFRDKKCDLFLSQKIDGEMIFTNYWKVLVLNFSVMRNTVFFSAKKLMERCYLHSFLSFPRYSRTWKIWFFVQYKLYLTGTDSFLVHIKSGDIFSDLTQHVETRFGTSNYEVDSPLPTSKN